MLNLSAAIAQPSSKSERALEEALDQAARRGVIVVAAAGNQGTLGATAITQHPWVIPVVAYDLRGRPIGHSNLGNSIGGGGWAPLATGSPAWEPMANRSPWEEPAPRPRS